MEQFVVYTNQSILYDSTVRRSGSGLCGFGLVRYSVLYYWLIPNRNINHRISLVMMRGAGVGCTKGLECWSNGRIILCGGEGALVFWTGLLGPVLVWSWVVPSSV